jgi:thiamine transport system permease protein
MRHLPGFFALGLILGVIGAAFTGLFLAAGTELPQLPWLYIGGVVRFTLLQAALSTAISLLLGAGLALALARRSRFAGRTPLIAALNLASVLPAIVAVFGIVAVLGGSGWLGQGARRLGLDFGTWLYGLPGILIAHVFFNAPLAARVFLGALSAVPGEHWRLAAQLGMPPGAILRLIDLPLLRREAPSLAALIFLLCFTSFAVVLALGGGPNAATLEVAIYEAVRFDVDFARAGILALLQVGICLLVALPTLSLAKRTGESAVTGIRSKRPDAESRGVRVVDSAFLLLGAVLVLPPLGAVAVAGMAAWRSLLGGPIWAAAATSLGIAIPAAVLAVALSVSIAWSVRALHAAGLPARARTFSMPGSILLAVPPVAISAGLFAVLRPIADPFALAPILIVLVNAILALPFVVRQVEPPLILAGERYGQLADSLGINGPARIRLVDWPLLRRPLLAAFAVATALSLGDLGVAAFFGTGDLVTLPLLLHQRLGAYRMERLPRWLCCLRRWSWRSSCWRSDGLEKPLLEAADLRLDYPTSTPPTTSKCRRARFAALSGRRAAARRRFFTPSPDLRSRRAARSASPAATCSGWPPGTGRCRSFSRTTTFFPTSRRSRMSGLGSTPDCGLLRPSTRKWRRRLSGSGCRPWVRVGHPKCPAGNGSGSRWPGPS